MQKHYTLIALAFLTTNALAKPSYVECDVKLTDKSYKFSVKLDEENTKVTHTDADGSAFNAEGFFSLNSIAYKHVQLYGAQALTQQYEINRVDLSIKYTFHAEPINEKYKNIIEPINTVSNGKCIVVQAKDRQL